MEAKHRRLVVDRVDGNRRTRKHQQVDWTIAHNLVCDVGVAAAGELRPRSLHSDRLATSSSTTKERAVQGRTSSGQAPPNTTLIEPERKHTATLWAGSTAASNNRLRQ